MFKKISTILSRKFSKKDDLSKQIQIVKVFDLYRDGDKSFFPKGPEARPISLRNMVLTIQATSSSHASELRIREYEIMETINHHFGSEVVKRILYRF